MDVIINSDRLWNTIVLLPSIKPGNNTAKPIDKTKITKSSTAYFIACDFWLTQM